MNILIATSSSRPFVLALLCGVALCGRAATFTPTTTTDFPVTGAGISVATGTGVISGGGGNGLITLRSAVIAANANSGSTINIPAGTYTLTIAGDDGSVDPNPAIGDLDVLSSVTIKGAGPGSTIIQGGTNPSNGIDQIITLNAFFWSTGKSAVVNGFAASVSGLTFRYGKCLSVDTQSGSFVGGAISFDAGYDNGISVASPGSMTISNCVFDSNSSKYGGGAIGTFDGGTVTIDSCTFTNNGVGATGNTSSGGAIIIGNTTIQTGTTTIKNSTFVKNVATSAGGAMLFFGGTPACFVRNCLVANNTSAGEGGGIYGSGSLTIDQGTIISNNLSAGTNNGDAQGGGLYLVAGPVVSNCTIVSNTCSLTSTDQRGGGGIAVGGGNVTISNCRIFGNVASTGSGLHKDLNTGIATAINNWWGNNGGPGVGGADSAVLGGGGSGGGAVLNSSPWLVMSFTASPLTLLTSGTSTLTTSITKNSASATGFTVPNGTPVSFGGTLGTDSPANTTLSSGTATSTYTAGPTGGTGSASATVDNQSTNVSLTINQPPLVTSATNATFIVGSSGTFTVTATGLPAPALKESGALPGVVTFNAVSGVLSGVPGAGTGGTYPLVFTATNTVGTNNQNFTLTVNQPPAITSVNNKTLKVGSVGSFTVTATGFPAPTFGESGALPGGVAFTNANGILGGTAAAGSGGIYPIIFTAHNGVGSDATQSFTLTVDQPPLITSATNTSFTAGIAGVFTVAKSGFPAPDLFMSGAFPNGVGFDPATGNLSGTPAAGTGGTYPLVITATNSTGTNIQNFTLTVNQTSVITSASSKTFNVGSASNFTVTASGFPAPALSESGALPSGVGFTNATGSLGGTPAAGTGGIYPITFTAHNGVGNDATQSFTLTVDQPPLITSATNATFTARIPGVFTVTKSGFPAPDLFMSGAFPNGVGFNPGTGNLSGTPAAGTGGTYPLVITATNSTGTNIQNFTLTVNQTSVITSASSKTFNVGSASNFTVTASGFPAPALSESGALPSGVGFTNATGSLGGTPVAGAGGIYPITFTAHNGVGNDSTQNFTLTINEAPMVSCPADVLTNATGGVCVLPEVSFAASATGFPAPAISYRLGGNPITSPSTFEVGTNLVSVTATNAIGSNSCTFRVSVLPGPAPQLAALHDGANVIVSWPASFSCYTLQFASVLASNSWQNYSGLLATNSGTVFATNIGAISNGFFRLSH